MVIAAEKKKENQQMIEALLRRSDPEQA